MPPSVRLGAAIGSVAAFVLLAPIAVAVVMLRCCDSATGAALGAWLAIGAVVLLAMAVGAAVGAALAAVVRIGVRRLSGAGPRDAGPPPT